MATLKDIADKAGVSVGTVDRIVHNRGRFADQTAKKVRRILRELEYQPNLMARQLSQSRNCRIAVVLPFPEQDSGYWALPLAGIRRAERDLTPFGLSLDVLHYNRYDPQSFNAVAKSLFETDYDGYLVTPLLSTEARRLVDRIGRRETVIYFDTDLPGSHRLSYIGQDSYQSGRLGARLINILTSHRNIKDSRNVLIGPDLENEHLNNRIRGFSESSRLDVETLRITIESDHNLDSLRQLLAGSIDGEVAGIFVIDASSHFVASYLDSCFSMDHEARPALVGYDLVPDNRKWVASGVIDFLLTQRPEEQGYNGINRLFRKILLDEDCPEKEYTPIDIVTQENLRYITEED